LKKKSVSLGGESVFHEKKTPPAKKKQWLNQQTNSQTPQSKQKRGRARKNKRGAIRKGKGGKNLPVELIHRKKKQNYRKKKGGRNPIAR